MTAPTVAADPAAEDDTVVLPVVPGVATGPDRPSRGRRLLVRGGLAATLLAGVLLGFVVFLLALSPLQEMHYQATSYQTFRYALGNAIAPRPARRRTAGRSRCWTSRGSGCTRPWWSRAPPDAT
jgi:sortase A